MGRVWVRTPISWSSHWGQPYLRLNAKVITVGFETVKIVESLLELGIGEEALAADRHAS